MYFGLRNVLVSKIKCALYSNFTYFKKIPYLRKTHRSRINALYKQGVFGTGGGGGWILVDYPALIWYMYYYSNIRTLWHLPQKVLCCLLKDLSMHRLPILWQVQVTEHHLHLQPFIFFCKRTNKSKRKEIKINKSLSILASTTIIRVSPKIGLFWAKIVWILGQILMFLHFFWPLWTFRHPPGSLA